MTQHIHNEILSQLIADPSKVVMVKMYDKDGNPMPPLEVKNIGFIWDDIQGKHELYIKPEPHPNDKYREAYERGENLWERLALSDWKRINKVLCPNWNFTRKEWEYSLTDPNPVDPYAHLRQANEEGRVAWEGFDGEWTLPQGGKWLNLGTHPAHRYKIVEPDLVWTEQNWTYPSTKPLGVHLVEEYTLSGLTGEITAKVVK